jgi:hypothetical protein
LDDDDEDAMAPDPAVAESSDGGAYVRIAVAVAQDSGGFPSLTALRRPDLLGLPKFTDKPWFVCRAWLFIEQRDRGPLSTNKGNAPDQDGNRSVEGDPDSIWSIRVEIYPTATTHPVVFWMASVWCEIHHTARHDLEECKMFPDRKKMSPPATPVAQEPHQGEHRWVDPDGDEQMGEINVIFEGSMSITSKTQGKKLEQDLILAQHIEPRRKMKGSDMDISFRPEGNIETELSKRNLSFVVKLPISRHKVAKALIDNRVSLNLIMRKTFIEMGLHLKDLTPIHDTFHGVIRG